MYYIPFAVAGDKLKPVGGPVEDAAIGAAPVDDINDRLFGVFAVITAVEMADDIVAVFEFVVLEPVPVPAPDTKP